MSIQHKANGIDLIRANGEVISLTLNEAYEIYHEMFLLNIKESVIYFINHIDEEDWTFETTKEEVLAWMRERLMASSVGGSGTAFLGMLM
jgi:hypothetical protein